MTNRYRKKVWISMAEYHDVHAKARYYEIMGIARIGASTHHTVYGHKNRPFFLKLRSILFGLAFDLSCLQ